MTHLLLFLILCALVPGLLAFTVDAVFVLVGLALVVIGIALCVLYPGIPVAIAFLIGFGAVFSAIAVVRQKIVDRRSASLASDSAPKDTQIPAKELELEANGHTVLFNRLMAHGDHPPGRK